MEHINVTQLPNGMLLLKPEKGYHLFDELSRRSFSEAVIKPEDQGRFQAVPDAVPEAAAEAEAEPVAEKTKRTRKK